MRGRSLIDFGSLAGFSSKSKISQKPTARLIGGLSSEETHEIIGELTDLNNHPVPIRRKIARKSQQVKVPPRPPWSKEVSALIESNRTDTIFQETDCNSNDNQQPPVDRPDSYKEVYERHRALLAKTMNKREIEREKRLTDRVNKGKTSKSSSAPPYKPSRTSKDTAVPDTRSNKLSLDALETRKRELQQQIDEAEIALKQEEVTNLERHYSSLFDSREKTVTGGPGGNPNLSKGRPLSRKYTNSQLIDDEIEMLDNIRHQQPNPRSKKSQTRRFGLDELRKVMGLESLAQEKLEALGIFDDSDSEGENSIFSNKKGKRSGMDKTASQSVKNPQLWPHLRLQLEYSGRAMTFSELTFRLFVAGELEIISEVSLPAVEREARLGFLKEIVYNVGAYEWDSVKKLYAAIVRRIELGTLNWGDDLTSIQSSILTRADVRKNSGNSKGQNSANTNNNRNPPRQSGKDQKDSDKVWFCHLFQKNKCKFKENQHPGTNKHGNVVTYHHICATCWLKNKEKLYHPESSSACPVDS